MASGFPDSLTPSSTSVSNQSALGNRAGAGVPEEQADRAITRTRAEDQARDKAGLQDDREPVAGVGFGAAGRVPSDSPEHIEGFVAPVQDARGPRDFLTRPSGMDRRPEHSVQGYDVTADRTPHLVEELRVVDLRVNEVPASRRQVHLGRDDVQLGTRPDPEALLRQPQVFL